MTAISIDPDRHRAALFAVDGVVTDTARKRQFDRCLADRPATAGERVRAVVAGGEERA